MKQTFMDADWYIRAWGAYESSGRAFLPPETSEALAALEPVVQGGQPALFETGSEEEYLRAHKIATDFGIDPWFRGSGQEYRIVDVLRGRSEPLIIPLSFPDAPDVDDPEAALNASLADLRHWYLAPARACSRYLRPEGLSDECEVDEGGEHDVELVEAREDPSEALEPAKETFDLVASTVEHLVEAPRMASRLDGWDDGREAQIQRQLPGLVALIGPIHDQCDRGVRLGKAAHQLSTRRRVVALARRQ